MEHLKRVTDEFTRQAQTFAVWAEKVDADVGARFGSALGKAASGRLIDVACGPGVVTAALAPNAASVVAFDATAQMLEKAKARCAKAGLSNVEFKSGDAENLPFSDAQFDGAVTRAAVHHFADPQRAINEMFRVLCPGGTVVTMSFCRRMPMNRGYTMPSIPRMSACCRHPSLIQMQAAPAFATFKRRPGI